MKTLFAIPLILLLLSCGNNKDSDSSPPQDSVTQTQKNHTPPDTIAAEKPIDIVAHWNDTCDKNYYGIRYIEDFMKFSSHKQIENYFGKDNVIMTEANYGDGVYPATYVFYKYREQVCIHWYLGDTLNDKAFFINQYHYYLNQEQYDSLKAGGSPYKYKYGLYVNMPLSEFLELNGQAVVFHGMYFRMSDQHWFGMILNGYLRPEFKNYVFHIGFIDEENTDKNAPDYKYLHSPNLFDPGYSTDDPNINISKLCINQIDYAHEKPAMYK